ncbi:hypothetical protein BOX15_Mlig025966g1, partial [Macrostomum lignano]
QLCCTVELQCDKPAYTASLRSRSAIKSLILLACKDFYGELGSFPLTVGQISPGSSIGSFTFNVTVHKQLLSKLITCLALCSTVRDARISAVVQTVSDVS